MIPYNADVDREVNLARKIGSARNTIANTIESNLHMYKSIEPDVEEYESVLVRLKNEITNYDGTFPEQHQQTAKNITIFDNELRRAQLLKQQIGVAKEIGAAEPSEQLSIWRMRMQPLLNDEDTLDNSK
jgi:hypothetical protein